MEQIPMGIERVQVYYDDILIAGRTEKEHVKLLDQVMTRLEEYGLRLNEQKCMFFRESVEYLGMVIDKNGIAPIPSKIERVVSTPKPKDGTQLRSYTRVTCDASRDGIAAILFHFGEDGQDRPVQFSSRALTPTERLYPQIEREALAIVFGLEKFYYYIYGRRFTLVTDNQTLTWIFHPNKSLPIMTAEKIQRWAFYVSQFDYEIEFKRGQDNNADYFSRMPVDPAPMDNIKISEIGYVFSVTEEVLPVTAESWMAEALEKDEESLRPYYSRSNEIGVERGCILMGLHLVIPEQLHKQILVEIHTGHQGIVKSKAIARSYVWWPGLDKDNEEVCKTCEACQRNKPNPQ
ncbi:hypothetical protein EB796_003640 [Bugula neritina]|uniref:Reverse transcriptase domain-containing protein n=1 Tax=Bugula neritina TaxID=10212 RepID=A0A7J7KHA1_BUGNE|nr:hypothetical protein EB796_003640 [Bugula neritina]